MPLPFLVWGVIAAGGAIAGAKTIKAVKDNSRASYYSERAGEIISSASEKADECRKSANESIESLGRVKLETVDRTIGSFLKSFGKIKNVNFSEVDTVSEFKNLNLDSANIAELSKMTVIASDVLKGTVSGGLAGAAAAYGAYGAVGWFASAGTGTAISGLSGAAATNATLAWLGGGTLAAGGGGIAAGTMVLGGIVAVPALLILGCVMGAKASKNLEEAKSNFAKANDYAEQMKLLCSTCRKIAKHSDFMCKAITSWAGECDKGVIWLKEAIDRYGTEWSGFPAEAKNRVAMLGSMVKLLKTLLDKKILTEDGKPSRESEPARLKRDYPNLAAIS